MRKATSLGPRLSATGMETARTMARVTAASCFRMAMAVTGPRGATGIWATHCSMRTSRTARWKMPQT